MLKNFKFIFGFFIIITLLTIEEIPYLNILIKDKLWVFVIISYLIFAALFIPYDFITKYRKSNYLLIAFVVTVVVLFILTLISIPILLEFFGIFLYGLFWVLVVYKIFTYLKSSRANKL